MIRRYWKSHLIYPVRDEALSLTDYRNENITQKNGPKDVKETHDLRKQIEVTLLEIIHK